jgi:hypothetical protein
MKTYQGTTTQDGDYGAVYVCTQQPRQRKKLRLRLDLANHSPTGFAWGYGGSGPAQLSLAILADFLGDDERALRLHQRFKFAVIGALEQRKPWVLTDNTVRKMVLRLENLIAYEEKTGDKVPINGIIS